MSVKRGEHIALVGASGSGKTTILKLICGFIRPQKGIASMFGVSLADWDVNALRRHIALVSQDSYLFPGTIRQNLLSGKGTASDDELMRVCQDAGIHELVVDRGLDADAGERGIKLSGGEQQRLSIARAMLKDAPLLLLDEPTAALDAKSEQIIQQSLDKLMHGKTTITVAHRLSTIVNSDRIFVLDKGQIVASGTHSQLMADCPTYQDLYQKQLRGEETSDA